MPVVTGRATRFAKFGLDPETETVRGLVVTVDDGKPVPGDTALVKVISARSAPALPTVSYVRGRVSNTGAFSARLPRQWSTAEAYYVPLAGYGDCTSARLTHGKQARIVKPRGTPHLR